MDVLALPVVRAQEKDAVVIHALLREAATWLWERGIHQWHPEGYTLAGVTRDIIDNEVYVVLQDGVALGTYRLQWTDPSIWGEEIGSDGLAGYVHQFAVARAVAGSGLGGRLLQFAEEQIVAQGRSVLRLDCWAGNQRLRQYYADAGFTFMGERPEGTWQCALWERPVAQTVAVP